MFEEERKDNGLNDYINKNLNIDKILEENYFDKDEEFKVFVLEKIEELKEEYSNKNQSPLIIQKTPLNQEVKLKNDKVSLEHETKKKTPFKEENKPIKDIEHIFKTKEVLIMDIKNSRRKVRRSKTYSGYTK